MPTTSLLADRFRIRVAPCCAKVREGASAAQRSSQISMPTVRPGMSGHWIRGQAPYIRLQGPYSPSRSGTRTEKPCSSMPAQLVNQRFS